MKTNKIKIAALGILAMGGLASCSDSWLDVDSKTDSNPAITIRVRRMDFARSMPATTVGSVPFLMVLRSLSIS